MPKNKELSTQGPRRLTSFLLSTPLLLSLLGLFLSGCGPVPPVDPFYLGEAKSNLSRGNHWYQVGCYQEANRFFEASLISARLSDNVLYIVMSLNAQGATYLALKDLPKAAQVLNEAIELTTAEPTQPELPALLGNMGTLAYLAGRFDDARDFWRRAADVSVERGQSAGTYLSNLARMEYEEGNSAEFERNLELAKLTLTDELTPKAARSDILNLAALQSMDRGDLSGALTLLEEATEIDRELENQAGLAQDLETRYVIHQREGNHALAAQSLSRAFYLRASLGDTKALKKDLGLLRESSKAHGHPENLAPFEAIAKKPALFDPLKEYCP
ncbi:MAG: tetratricopeptide repeat protein, partial [Deltaproteobacteria bacterium]|nr:tetratricopeptide repeat protein [Deltaproteobacteria bacterium]